ncbi:MAG: glutathione S-transferase family protein [Rhizobiales bacterium]|nr:glutathione S-transferase family protein [Hyphomicrobiales bacterium]
MLTLYKAGNSICTQKVLITLAEKEISYDTVNINLFKNEQYEPAYLTINPKGVVPSLVHDGKVVVESTLICEYLDESVPEPPLVPADPYLHARMRLWSKAIDEGLFEATRELSFSAMFRERLRGMTEEQRQRRFRNVGDPERRARYQSCYGLGVESPYVFQGIADFEKAFKAMERDLAAQGPWLLGDAFTLADINLMPFVARLEYLNLLDLWVADRPHVQTWWRHAKARPSFSSAIADALSDAEVSDMRTFGSRIRERVGERRAEYLSDAPEHTMAGAA